MTSLIASAIVITPITVPKTLDAADAAPFRAISVIGNARCRHDAGHDYFDESPEEMLPGWQDQTDRTRLGFIAQRDGQYVGVLTIDIPNEQGTTSLEFDAMTDPEHSGDGVEEALLCTVEDVARLHGRTRIQTWTLHRADATGQRLVAPTGYGSIPAEDPQTVFLCKNGFTFEQTERNSVYDLHGSNEIAERMLATSLDVAGPDYEVISWTAPTPDRYKADFAVVMSRMATDPPAGGMIWEEETWDAGRIERRDARLLDGGHAVSVVCVRHIPTDRLVAFNELMIGTDRSGPTHQGGTLVIPEHRGHRLGTIVKCANLLRWREMMPGSPRVSTFNSEDNRPMLDINEAVGFVPASYAGAWQKVLDV